uniref:glutamate receptor-interacting protein 2-like n=1 Tax=Myxine glutinosa TaxID=7769 RepID=UPI00358F1F94
MITVSFKCRFRMLKGVIKDDSGCMRGSVSTQDSPSAQVQAPPSFRQSIPEECKGRVTVELLKKEASSLGLSISGGADKESLAWVSNLRPGGVASRSDELCIGDLLRGVNGIRLSRLQHDEIVSLLSNVGKRAVLDVEYLLPALPDGNTITKTLEVSLQKEVNSFGFILRGGFHPDSCKSRHLVIVHIRPGGPTDREGSLRIGDRLVGVDGACVRAFSLEDVLALLRCCGHESELLVEYDCCNPGTMRSESVPMTVELVETTGASLGIALSTTTFEMGQKAVIIENVRAGSAADRFTQALSSWIGNVSEQQSSSLSTDFQWNSGLGFGWATQRLSHFCSEAIPVLLWLYAWGHCPVGM